MNHKKYCRGGCHANHHNNAINTPCIDIKKMPDLIAIHKQTCMTDKSPWQWHFLHPKYWGIWFALMIFLPLIYLPLRIQFWLGRKIGELAYALIKRRVKDTLTNLNLAFPDKSDDEKVLIAKQVFVNQGIGIFETLNAWFRPNVFKRTFSISGLQHLISAQNNNQAVILLGGHFTTLDLMGRIATQFFAVDCVYRKQNNPVLEWLIYNNRRHIYDEQISSRNMKKLISRIKDGKVIWYSPDQDFGLEHGVMATFFGVPAATITAQRRFYAFSKENPPIFMMIDMIRQTPDHLPTGKHPHYHMTITPIANYPSKDEMADAQHINDMIEHNIKKDITQWMWFHRRFKTQADGRNYYQQKSD